MEIDLVSFLCRAILLLLGLLFLGFGRCPIEILDKCESFRQIFGNWMSIEVCCDDG